MDFSDYCPSVLDNDIVESSHIRGTIISDYLEIKDNGDVSLGGKVIVITSFLKKPRAKKVNSSQAELKNLKSER